MLASEIAMKTEMISQIYVSDVVVRVWFPFTLYHTHTHLTRNYICSHIYQDFIITAPSYTVLFHLMIRDLANMARKLPEDGVLTPKHVRVI